MTLYQEHRQIKSNSRMNWGRMLNFSFILASILPFLCLFVSYLQPSFLSLYMFLFLPFCHLSSLRHFPLSISLLKILTSFHLPFILSFLTFSLCPDGFTNHSVWTSIPDETTNSRIQIAAEPHHATSEECRGPYARHIMGSFPRVGMELRHLYGPPLIWSRYEY